MEDGGLGARLVLIGRLERVPPQRPGGVRLPELVRLEQGVGEVGGDGEQHREEWPPTPAMPRAGGQTSRGGVVGAAAAGGSGGRRLACAALLLLAAARSAVAVPRAGPVESGAAESALVCDRERGLNGPLRFDEEPARHKTLDLLGDLALLGALPRARIVAYKAGHRMHVALARKLAEEGRQNKCGF